MCIARTPPTTLWTSTVGSSYQCPLCRHHRSRNQCSICLFHPAIRSRRLRSRQILLSAISGIRRRHIRRLAEIPLLTTPSTTLPRRRPFPLLPPRRPEEGLRLRLLRHLRRRTLDTAVPRRHIFILVNYSVMAIKHPVPIAAKTF